jgi:indole-3-glycerol phosphate synthase
MYLDRIVATKREEVERLKETFRLSEAEKNIAELPPCRGFVRALTERRRRKVGLIAEVKKASPSKGLIRPDFEPVSIAKAYESSGADCLSVLTDVQYFQGSNDYLTRVRDEVSLPILRKDFTIDYRQIYEARMIGADAVLLIAAILTTERLSELLKAAHSIGMDVLVEVHDQEELERVLSIGGIRLIGINNRNLKTFVTDLKTTETLIRHIPEQISVVSESGISSPAEMQWLQEIGADAVLIGEHFMRQTDIAQAVIDLMEPVS